MSLEAAADEERRMVLDRLEPKPRSPRSDSPVVPVRSMLDVSSGPVPRHGSIAGIGVGITAGASGPQSPTYRSMLDVTSPIVSPQQPPTSKPLSPTTTAQTSLQNPRRSSADSVSKGSQTLPKIVEGKVNAGQNHQFNVLPIMPGQPLPKLATQSGKPTSTAMAAAMSGDLDALPAFGRAREGRHNSTVGIGGKSSSPSSRISPRSESPGTNTLSASALSTPMPSNAYVTNSGKVVDMDKAYRKLSDKSTGGSSSFSSGDYGDNARVHLDPVDPEEDEAAVEDSDWDEESSTDEEELSSEASRGRRRSRRKKGSMDSEGDGENQGPSETTLGMGKAQGPREAQSLMAAAEEERK